MAKLYYASCNGRARKHILKSPYLWCAVVSFPSVMGLALWGLTWLLPKQKNAQIDLLHNVMINAVKALFIIGGAMLSLYFAILIIRFLFLGNPYNRGHFLLRY